MDLQEEYFSRKKVRAPLVKYVENANLILRAKEGVRTEWNWLHVSINCKQEPNHPAYYNFVVAANPVIYASPDFSHFSYHHSKILSEHKYEWDQYEPAVLDLVGKQSQTYTAVPSSDAVFVSWEMFLSNYDSWLANFLPYRVIDNLAGSLSEPKNEDKLKYISEVEEWISQKYERVYMCWRNIRQNLDQKNYADWLVDLVNNKAA